MTARAPWGRSGSRRRARAICWRGGSPAERRQPTVLEAQTALVALEPLEQAAAGADVREDRALRGLERFGGVEHGDQLVGRADHDPVVVADQEVPGRDSDAAALDRAGLAGR